MPLVKMTLRLKSICIRTIYINFFNQWVNMQHFHHCCHLFRCTSVNAFMNLLRMRSSIRREQKDINDETRYLIVTFFIIKTNLYSMLELCFHDHFYFRYHRRCFFRFFYNFNQTILDIFLK